MSVVGFIIKFLDPSGNQRNPHITEDPNGNWRLSDRETSALDYASGQQVSLPVLNEVDIVVDNISSEKFLSGINISGNADAVFKIFLNAETIPMYEKRLTIGQPSSFDVFPAKRYLNDGDKVTVTVTNLGRANGDFFCSIYYNR